MIVTHFARRRLSARCTTLTFELRPHPQLILKLEGRYDRSTADAFGGRDGPLTKRDGFLFVLCAVATF